MSKKRYFINVHFDCVVPVEVEAENESEAIRLAKETSDLSDYDDCYIYDACVCSVEPVK